MLRSVVSVVPTPVAPPTCTVADHERMKADPVVWASLPLCGYQGIRGQDAAELRHCPHCRTTLARECRITSVEFIEESAVPAWPVARAVGAMT